MKIMFLDDLHKDFVFEIIKKEPSFHYNKNLDFNFLSINMFSVFDKENNFIGFFGLTSMDYALCICFLYIFKDYRNKGYAKKILNTIKNEYHKDYPYIYLLVDKNNKAALTLYKPYKFLANDRNSFIPGIMLEDALKNNMIYMVDNSYEVIIYYDKTAYQEKLKKYHYLF